MEKVVWVVVVVGICLDMGYGLLYILILKWLGILFWYFCLFILGIILFVLFFGDFLWDMCIIFMNVICLLSYVMVCVMIFIYLLSFYW